MNHLIILPVVVPLFVGVFLLLSVPSGQHTRRALSLTGAVLLLPLAVALLVLASDGRIHVYALGNWPPPFGIALVLDRLSALMLALTAVLAVPALWYACRGDDRRGANFHALFQFQLMGLNGAFLTGDLFNLFVFFEVLLIASYGLVLHGAGAARTKAGLHYVVLNLAGSALFLLALGMIYASTGTLNMADLARRAAQLQGGEAALLRAGGLLLLAVFGLKAALAPLYFWLPRAYAAAVAPVAALFAIMTKVGVYALIRVFPLVFAGAAAGARPDAAAWLWPVALVTILLGGLGALAADSLRRLTAWLVVLSVGTLVAGLAVGTPAAIVATLYYLVHSTLATAALFLLADLLARRRGPVADSLVAGPPLPHSALFGGLFLLCAILVVGLPPLSGFIGKVALLRAAPPGSAWPFWVLLLLSSLFGLISLSRAGSTLFWRTAGEAEAQPGDSRRVLAMLVLPLCLLALTVAAQPVFEYLGRTVTQLRDIPAYTATLPEVTP